MPIEFKFRTMMKRMFTGLLVVLLFSFSGIAATGNHDPAPTVRSGTWRAVLQRPDGQQIVFNFISEKKNGRLQFYVINGEEKLLVDSITQENDSLFIQMPFFASGFRVRIKSDGNLEGVYIKRYADNNQVIPFFAEHGNEQRYKEAAGPRYNVTGRWRVTFPGNGDLETRAVGEFVQDEHGKVTGTFLTPTGDYRYLEGSVSGDSIRLSAFDGGHAVLFAGNLTNDTTIENGFLFSGLSFKEGWSAVKDSAASLPDSYQLTKMREGETKLNFRFVSTDGDTIGINDERFRNKLVIVQILGSWCPNCMDETKFLSEYYEANKDKGIEIVALAYERTPDVEAAKKALRPFRERFNVGYPFLITGVSVSDAKRTEKTLPQIDAIKAFPTTIFIGKDGKVDKIHTGFNGPGTGEHYLEFKKEFDEEISSLLSDHK
jgi:thiol-disulfide isomerase/thioredoxin